MDEHFIKSNDNYGDSWSGDFLFALLPHHSMCGKHLSREQRQRMREEGLRQLLDLNRFRISGMKLREPQDKSRLVD